MHLFHKWKVNKKVSKKSIHIYRECSKCGLRKVTSPVVFGNAIYGQQPIAHWWLDNEEEPINIPPGFVSNKKK